MEKSIELTAIRSQIQELLAARDKMLTLLDPNHEKERGDYPAGSAGDCAAARGGLREKAQHQLG